MTAKPMNQFRVSLRILGAMTFLFMLSLTWTMVRAADEHAHDAAHGKLMLNDGQKWATDAPLRLAMSRISKALGARLPAIHADKLGAADYVAQGKSIDGDVAYMVNNCKLPRNADAMLHLVLADIIAGSDAMQGKLPGTSARAGAVKVVQALDSYGKYFDHPGWQKLEH
ncbi:MAG TPA: hypothetical protein VF523_13880 [Burkholderiales bacterium]